MDWSQGRIWSDHWEVAKGTPAEDDDGCGDSWMWEDSRHILELETTGLGNGVYVYSKCENRFEGRLTDFGLNSLCLYTSMCFQIHSDLDI